MADVQTLQQRLAEVERERERARRAEEARIAAEQAHRQTLADADKQIAELKQQLSAARFEEAKAYSNTLVEANAAAVGPLIEAVTGIERQIIDVLGGTGAAVDNTFTQWERHADTAIQEAVNSVDLEAMGDQRIDSFQRTGMNFRKIANQHNAQLNTALPLAAALADWINKSPDNNTRRWRMGIGYALTGHLMEPGPNYDPHKAVADHRRSQIDMRL